MSLLCRICGETTLSTTGAPNSPAALTASSAEDTSRPGTTGIPAALSSCRAASSDHRPARRPAGGMVIAGRAGAGSRCRVAWDHQATLRSATTAWRRPGMT